MMGFDDDDDDDDDWIAWLHLEALFLWHIGGRFARGPMISVFSWNVWTQVGHEESVCSGHVAAKALGVMFSELQF